MGAEQYEVKGSTILSKFDFVEEELGSSAINRVRTLFMEKDAFPIIHSNWYSFDLYVELLEAIALEGYEGDLARLVEVGVYAADSALQETYKSFVKPGGFREFLEDIPRLHGLLYNQGAIDVTMASDGLGCTIVHRDKPRYAKADLYVASGFYTRAGQLHDLADLQCTFDLPEASGHNGARFSLSWS